jgi:succinyl-CoA synthetase alpha subunit
MAVLLDQNARILAVGATGPYGSAQIAFMRSAGSVVVGAASLGRGGSRVEGLDVYDDIAEAVAATGADTAMVYTPAAGVKQALLECADAGLRLAAVAAEFVPAHDALYGVAYARERGLWIVGPNTVGMTSPGQAMLGAIAPSFTRPGHVGLIGRSGTLTMTIARQLTARGVGQSTVVHVGGDGVAGANPDEWLQLFLEDAQTAVVAFVGEIGGTKEYAMLDVIASAAKPVVAMIVGRHAPPGRRMGHAGALIGGERETAGAKLAALREAGALAATTPSDLVRLILDSLPTTLRSPHAVTGDAA